MKVSFKYQFFLASAMMLMMSNELLAQDSYVPGIITRVQGRGVYLNIGREFGMHSDDTLAVRVGLNEPTRVRVIGASSGSSLVTWIGRALDISVGDTLHLSLRAHLPQVSDEFQTSGQPIRHSLMEPPATVKKDARQSRRPNFSGRILISFNGLRSETRSASDPSGRRTNTFATPTFSFRGVVSKLPGETTLSINARGSYRHNSRGIIDRPGSLRLYQVSISRILPGTAFGIQAGRFSNRNEPETGYWDGVMIQRRSRHFEFGIAAGLEPDRFDEGFRSDLPKYSAHLVVRPSLGKTSWMSSVSFTQMRPGNNWLTHSYFGIDNRIRIKPLTVSNDIQLDRDPGTEKWIVSRFRARVDFRMFSGLSLHARHSFRQPYSFWRTDQVFSYRRDQTTVSLNFSSRWARMGMYATRNTFDSAEDAFSYSMNISVPHIPVMKISLNASTSYWTRQTSQTTYATLSVSKQVGSGRFQILYSVYRASLIRDTVLSQTVGASAQVPLRKNLQLSLQGRTLFSDEVVNTSMFISLWMSF